MKTIKKLSDVAGQVHRYKKKPVVIKAIKLFEEVEIHTREGILKGYPGDYIIEGVEGEIYPCDQVIFWKTYEGVK